MGCGCKKMYDRRLPEPEAILDVGKPRHYDYGAGGAVAPMQRPTGPDRQWHNQSPTFHPHGMAPCHPPMFTPNQPPVPPPPCGCCVPPPPPQKGPHEYIPSRLYPDFERWELLGTINPMFDPIQPVRYRPMMNKYQCMPKQAPVCRRKKGAMPPPAPVPPMPPAPHHPLPPVPAPILPNETILPLPHIDLPQAPSSVIMDQPSPSPSYVKRPHHQAVRSLKITEGENVDVEVKENGGRVEYVVSANLETVEKIIVNNTTEIKKTEETVQKQTQAIQNIAAEVEEIRPMTSDEIKDIITWEDV